MAFIGLQRVSTQSRGLRRFVVPLGRVALCAAVLVPVLYLLGNHLGEMDRAEVAASLQRIPLAAIAISVLLTAISLLAAAQYDDVALRQLGFAIPQRRARQGGFVAIGLSQTLGMGLLTGTVVRWRLYRDQGIGLPQAGLISGMVAAGFMGGFAVVLAAIAMVDPMGLVNLTEWSPATIRTLAAGVLLASLGVAVASLLQPRLTFGRFSIGVPRFRVLRMQIALAAVDTIPAALALWVLIPAESAPAMMIVIPVYLAALGVGLLSNTPGGLGVLELACLSALTVTPPETLVAALIAHRAIYFGIPALLSAALLATHELHGRDDDRAEDVRQMTPRLRAVPGGVLPAFAKHAMKSTSRADAALVYQGDKSILTSPCEQAFLMVRQSGNTLIALGDPVGDRALWPAVVDQFIATAQHRFLAPVAYKSSAGFADLLQEQELSLAVRTAQEAIVDPREFAMQGSSFRELRRKLRNSEKAGVSLEVDAPGASCRDTLRLVAAEWSEAKGGERGFSMGTFDPDYIARFPVVRAMRGGDCVGFLTLWQSGDGCETGFDVMRLTDDAPDGTMHALVVRGIEWAGEQGAERFTLCAVPFADVADPANIVERLLNYANMTRSNWHGCNGLHRFKNSFRPEWEPRFTVAPGLLSGLTGAQDIHSLIASPVMDRKRVDLLG